MSDPGSQSVRQTKIDITFREFEKHLRELLPLRQQEIHMSDRIEAIIPPEDRRRVWRELQLAGFDLARLKLSRDVFIIVAFLVLESALVFGLLFGWWTMVICFVGLSLLACCLTRPLAIHPSIGCETVEQLVIHLTRFVLEDYKAGLWTHEEIAVKVRAVLAVAAGVPVQNIKDNTRLLDLFP